MEMRNIGSLSVSVVGLGRNNFGGRIDEAQTKLVVDAAIDSGINHFDTADIYGATVSEQFLGRALGQRRKDVIVATKAGMKVDDERHGAHPDYIERACNDSLSRLSTDYIDLYWLHQPDESVPIADTLGAFDRLINAGKVREIGCSNFTVAQLEEARQAAQSNGLRPFITVQNEYSMFVREPENLAPADVSADPQDKSGVLAYCAKHNMTFVPYFPLASGLLTGKYRKGEAAPEGTRLASERAWERFEGDSRVSVVEKLIDWIQTRNEVCFDVGATAGRNPFTLLDLAISWLLRHDCVASVIAGATRPEQVRANASACNWVFTDDELTAVDSILAG